MSAALFTPAWLGRDPRALRFLPRAFDASAARSEAVAGARARGVHPAVLGALRASTPAQRANLDVLGRGAACVVTGQQAGLFGGPLYTVYKAAAAIVDARALSAETGAPCVPVFWLQNEDHDFAEISACQVLAGAGLRTVAVSGEPDGVSVAARRLGSDVQDALDAVEDAVAGLSDADPAVALLRRCYTPDASPDAAFRAWLEALFAPHGLLVLDPADPALVDAARPVHARALQEADAIATALLERSAALEAAGFAAQVHVRPGSPLSFFHPEGPGGPRYRLEPEGPGYRLCGTDRVVSRSAVEGAHFSTSALLRPILQDLWLPTAAYVGGPGEIAYFAQLPPLYAHFDLPVPLVVPRARFRVVDETSARLLRQLGLAADDLAEARTALLARIGRARDGHPDPDALEAALLGPIRAALSEFAPHARALDDGLAKATEKTTATLTEGAARLIDRYRRTLALRDEVAVQRLDRVLARLQPGGAPQERVHGWPWYGARFGVHRFVEAVIDAVAPFDGALKELSP